MKREIMFEEKTQRRTHWWQFRLRTLLLIVTVAAVATAWYVAKRRTKAEAIVIEAITNSGGRLIDRDNWFEDYERPVPETLTKRSKFQLFPASVLRRVVAVTFEWNAFKNDGNQFVPPKVPCTIDSAALHHLKSLPNLTWLSFRSTQLTNSQLECLRHTPNLKTLRLDRCFNLTDRGLVHLKSLQKLEVLDLSHTRLTDRALSVLKELPRLRFLDLSHTHATKTAVSMLAQCKSLEIVDLSGTPIRYDDVVKLKKLLPTVHVEWEPIEEVVTGGEPGPEPDLVQYPWPMLKSPLEISPHDYAKINELKPEMSGAEIEEIVRGQQGYGIACGVGVYNGETCGYCSRSYLVHLPGFDVMQIVSLSYLEPRGQDPVLTSFSGPGFVYRLEAKKFVRQKH